MAIFNFIKSQLIEVIEWTDDTRNTILYRFLVANKEIKMGANLTVRESQVAVFVNEGQIADVYVPGRYQLSTQNMPVLTKLKSWKTGFNSPFKAEVYFINTRQFTEQKWGTQNPVMMRDAEFGVVRLRAFGIFAFKVSDPVVFFREISGTSGLFSVEDLSGQLKKMVVSELTDFIAEQQIPVIDMAMYYKDIGETARLRMLPKFEEMGVALSSLFIENISLPEEVEKMLDKKTSMNVIGDINRYAQFNAADAIKDAANNPGMGGMGVGMGAGAAFGKMIVETMNSAESSNPASASKSTVAKPVPVIGPSSKKDLNSDMITCAACGQEIAANYKFCPECGANPKPVPDTINCAACGQEIAAGSKFCPECGEKTS